MMKLKLAKFGSLVAATAVAVAGLAPVALAETRYLVGLNLKGFCADRGRTTYYNQYESSRVFATNRQSAYTWQCQIVTLNTPVGVSYKEQRGFDMSEVCRWQHGNPRAYAKAADPKNALSWSCFRP